VEVGPAIPELLTRPLDGRLVGHVGHGGVRPPAARANPGHRGLEVLAARARDRDGRVFLNEPERDRAADPAASTGHDRDPARELSHRVSFLHRREVGEMWRSDQP